MNNPDTPDVVLEMDMQEASSEMRAAEMNLWTQQLAGLIQYLMLEDDQN